ncbi:MAG: outer membrane protein assembly factor BamA [Acidobacteria bacterium RIFCSPLOWO2_12_FULL_54_10]|nr:MAG: outer membrane protein assembly factor BamA [Acidobacteria bacterium RIFCSPLOWO2_12_FULL_54_10]
MLGAQDNPPKTIESIQFRGNRRVPAATLRSRILTQPGDIYNENALRRDFMALFNTGFFDDIVLRADDGDTGTIITFEVKERPNIRSIEYKGNKSVTHSDILNRFKERNVGLTVESRYDPTRIKRAEVVLKQLLGERGRQFATVTVDAKDIPPSSIALTFEIDEGPKVKVGRIQFEGNKALSSGKLARSMKNLRPVGIPYSLIFEKMFSKTYDKAKLDEDQERIRAAYQDDGYFRASVNDPKISTRATGGGAFRIPWLYPNRPGRKIDITIPLVEGEQYYLGSMKFEGVSLFTQPDAALRPLFAMNEGDLFDVSQIRKGLENMRNAYGEYGYINFVASPDTQIDDENHQINMVFSVEEGKQFTVRRIEFTGNSTTRDKVIRRELMVQEGSLFNSRLWELSLLRLNQLDYFEKLTPENSNVQPDNRSGAVDIALQVKEKGKNAIGFTGGVSGLTGSFVGFNYQTNNFMGRGETFSFDAQLGSLERNLFFSVTHPYAFDRPLQIGVSVFSRRFNFNEADQASIFSGQDVRPIFDLLGSENIQNYRQSSAGFTAFASYPLSSYFSRLGFTYGYESSKVTTFSDVSERLFQDLNFNGFAGTDSLAGIRISKIVPTFTYNTVDHPLTPSRGTSFFASLELTGLGGNVRMIRPTIDLKAFRPFTGGGRTFGLHLTASTTTGYGGRVIPPFSRFYGGGETDIRGFDYFTISPIGFIPDVGAVPVLRPDGTPRTTTSLDQLGQESQSAQTMPIPINRITFPGGDTKLVANVEYRIPLFGPVSLSAFWDQGANFAWKKSQLEITPERLQELANNFPNVNFQKQVELASDTNLKWRASTGIELQVILPIVNAPFRVYWAYNPMRLRTNISPKPLIDRAFFPNEATYQGAIDAFGTPQAYEEPKSTFRFTVGRTF